MAATYTEITREEFETWIRDYASKTKAVLGWQKVSTRVGGYDLVLSQGVAIRVASSQTRSDRAMARGKGAIHVTLVSLKSGSTLNRKGAGQTRVNRTLNWKANLSTVCNRLLDVYLKSKKFYEQKADPGKMQEYAATWLRKIESYRGWEANNFLSSIHEQLEEGRILSTNQENAVEKALSRGPSPAGRNQRSPEQSNVDWGAYIESSGVEWHRNRFLADIVSKVNKGWRLTKPQQNAVMRTIHRMRWVNRLRAVWREVPEDLRESVKNIGLFLTGKKGGKEWLRVDGPPRDLISTLVKAMPGKFEDLAAGPLPPGDTKAKTAAMASRVVSRYICSS